MCIFINVICIIFFQILLLQYFANKKTISSMMSNNSGGASKTSKAEENNKKYVQLSPDTVSMLAESIGISGNSLSSNVSRALAEDVSYRCRELANICSQLMRHSKRKKLSTDDVERALKWYDARAPSLGHQHNDVQPSYVQVPDVGRLRDGEAIYAPEEQVIGIF